MASRRSTAARGYGAEHQAYRRQLKPLVEAGLVNCARCGRRIKPGEPFDVGHVDGSERTVYSGAEHRLSRHCPAGGNRATAKHKKVRELREKRRRGDVLLWSRVWYEPIPQDVIVLPPSPLE